MFQARPTNRQIPVLAAGLLMTLLLGACSTPVGVKRIDPKGVHRELTSTVLSTGELSQPTRNVLYQQDLTLRFEDDPTGAIAELREVLIDGWGGPSEVYALAELCFHYAEESGDRAYYLATVVYATAFILPDDPEKRPPALDPRRRTAADLYNRGLTEGFASADGRFVELRGGSFPLPFGSLEVSFDEAKLIWGSRRLDRFVAVANLEVSGLATRYRWPGLGAPLAAGTEPLDAEKGFDDFVEPWVKVPTTALLRIDDPGGQLGGSVVQGSLDLIVATGPQWVSVNKQTVPLEVETSASLAYMLAESPIWQQEIAGFLRGTGVIDEKTRLAALGPRVPGRIPIVLVHGTASSAGRWAQMINELFNDPRLQSKYQFWLFTYDTGNPILYSAMVLRESLRSAVKRLDPDGKDESLRQMVVIGHSQGGLLTRLMATGSGTQFWDSVSKKPFADATFSDKTRDLLQKTVFFEPLPFVKRLIFVATPHGGSYVAGNPVAHWVTRFITFPLDVLDVANDLVRLDGDQLRLAGEASVGSAVSNMTPGSRFVKNMAAIPLAHDVPSHSIVAVQGDGPPDGLDDGVVEYTSAHVPWAESEVIVRSGHSCQDNPHTIAEIRRILLIHSATF